MNLSFSFPFLFLISWFPLVDPDYGKLISDSITETHNELLRTNPNKNPSDGSSVLACVVAKNIVTCANLGDSKAVLSRGYSAFDLSSSHQPNRMLKLFAGFSCELMFFHF
jgi:serine/threonine protein phosphatase PrpC